MTANYIKRNQPAIWHNSILITTAAIGVFFGLFSSINHGFFEILQGFQPTNGILIDAIGPYQRFWTEGTEPALTLIPNYLISGIVAVVIGIAIIIWSIWYLPSRQGRTVYLSLFLLSFLLGGGIGQAFFFLPAWAFSTWIEKPPTGWRKALPGKIRPVLAKLWAPSLFLAGLLMLIGLEMAIFGYFPGINDLEILTNLNMAFVFSAAALCIFSYIAGIGRELLRIDKLDREMKSIAKSPGGEK